MSFFVEDIITGKQQSDIFFVETRNLITGFCFKVLGIL